MFLFSSRRRHTRSLRDWSSDVCSSDLLCNEDGRRNYSRPRDFETEKKENVMATQEIVEAQPRDRSEERRVGKECRCRGWPYQGNDEMDREYQAGVYQVDVSGVQENHGG